MVHSISMHSTKKARYSKLIMQFNSFLFQNKIWINKMKIDTISVTKKKIIKLAYRKKSSNFKLS